MFLTSSSALCHGLLPVLLLTLLLLATYGQATLQECTVDIKGDPLDPNNLFRCPSDQKCCHEAGLPTCCAQKATTVAAVEQAQLWGIIGGFIVALGVLMWCCRHDGDCCCNDKDGRHSCCGKSCGRMPNDKYIAVDEDGNEILEKREPAAKPVHEQKLNDDELLEADDLEKGKLEEKLHIPPSPAKGISDLDDFEKGVKLADIP